VDYIEPNRLIGALGAVACGFGIRYLSPIIGVGGAAGAAVVVGACLIAIVDAMSG